MFKYRPKTGVPGFRVGLPDDEDGSAPSAAPAIPGASTFGYDPGASALQTTAPMASNPFGTLNNADSGLYPPPDRPADLYAGSGANPFGFGDPQGPPAAPANLGELPFGYDPYTDAPQTTVPTVLSRSGKFYNADSGLYPALYRAYVPFAGGLPSQDPMQQPPNRPANLYAGSGANPLSFGNPQGLNANTSPAPRAGVLSSDPQGNGILTLAGYGAGDTPDGADQAGMRPGAAQDTSGEDDSPLIQSAQAQTPQAQTPIDTSPGEVVVLPDGSTIPDPKSPTGRLMSPIADLSAVAAAGRRTGFAHRAMLVNLLTAAGAPAYMAASLYANVSQRGTFDYQRREGHFLGQFTPVSNVNVGLFSQQAGLSLEETLTIAGLYARWFSDNARPGEPYGLNPNQLKFITAGFKIGQSGVFGAPARP